MKHIKEFKMFESEEHEEDMDIDTPHEEEDMEITRAEEEDMEITRDEDDEEYRKTRADKSLSKPPLHSTRKREPAKHEPYLGADFVKTFRRLSGFHY